MEDLPDDPSRTMIIPSMNPPITGREAPQKGLLSKWFYASTRSRSNSPPAKSASTLSHASKRQRRIEMESSNISHKASSAINLKKTPSKTEPGQSGRGLMELGEAQANLGNWDKAFSFWDQALQLQKRELGPHHIVVAMTRERRARAFFHLRQWYPAAVDYGKAAHIFVSCQQDSLASDALMQLAMAQEKLGRLDEAIHNMEEAIDLKKKLQDEEGVARLYCLMGYIHHQRRDYQLARESYRIGLECYEKAGVSKDHPDVIWATRRASDRSMIGHLFWEQK